jgi:hypothetical protein
MLGILRIRVLLCQKSFPCPLYFPSYPVGNAAISLTRYLTDEKKSQMGKRVLLIPYNIGGYHWVGISIFFDENNLITNGNFQDSCRLI